jgi:hypothetical protein
MNELAHPSFNAPTKELKMRGSYWPVRGKRARGRDPAILSFFGRAHGYRERDNRRGAPF